MSWRVVPEVCKNVQFARNTDFAKFMRYWQWRMSDGRKYGMLYQDRMRYIFPEVREAVRRLSIREPHEYDARQMRIMRAHNLAMNNEMLPKEQWTKWEEDNWYLTNYLNEIEEEKVQRSASTGTKAPWHWWDAYSKHEVEGHN